MENRTTAPEVLEEAMSEIVRTNGKILEEHLGELVRSTVEETLNGLLDAEADHICGAERYERSPDRVDSRSGHYQRKLKTKSGEVKLKVPKLRKLPFESAIIERLPPPRELRRGVSCRDVPGGYLCAPRRKHHRGVVGRARQSGDDQQPEQEDLRPD